MSQPIPAQIVEATVATTAIATRAAIYGPWFVAAALFEFVRVVLGDAAEPVRSAEIIDFDAYRRRVSRGGRRHGL